MKTQLRYVLLLWAVCMSQNGYSETNSVIKIRPAGLRIVAPGFGNNDQSRPFNYPSGTSISLLIVSSGPGIIKVNVDDSRVDWVKDNRGTDLTKLQVGSWGGLDISEDKKRSTYEIECKTPPARGATSISGAGHINLTIGKQRKSHEAKNAKLVKSALLLEGLKASITEVEEVLGGKYRKIRLRVSGKDASLVESVQFFDSGGQTISASSQGDSGFYENQDSGFRDLVFILPAKTESATLRFNLWSETVTLNVPFRFKVGLGL